MTEHTPEPWTNSRGLAKAYGEANAARIVACVNACEGLADPSVVPELLRLLTVALARVNIAADEAKPGEAYFLGSYHDEIRAALRKAKGVTNG